MGTVAQSSQSQRSERKRIRVTVMTSLTNEAKMMLKTHAICDDPCIL